MTRFGIALLASITATSFTGSAHAAVLIGDVIDVDYDHRFARTHYWCAAGHAVISAGKPMTTMIYRTSPAHRSAGEGMSFALTGNLSGPWNAMTANRVARMCSGGGLGTEDSVEPEVTFDPRPSF